MKIAYLEAGPLLDYWVAKAAGYEPVYAQDSPQRYVVIFNCLDSGQLVEAEPLARFSPSTKWSDAGPIIEHEKIDLVHDFGRWMARHSKRDDYSRPDVSPLVAAMRAYLAWEYGDELPSAG
jgi:hypothetical protein